MILSATGGSTIIARVCRYHAVVIMYAAVLGGVAFGEATKLLLRSGWRLLAASQGGAGRGAADGPVTSPVAC